MKRKWLPVHPTVCIEVSQFVASGVGGIVAVVGKLSKVVAVGYKVGLAVEQIVFRMRDNTLHFALAKTAVDTEGE